MNATTAAVLILTALQLTWSNTPAAEEPRPAAPARPAGTNAGTTNRSPGLARAKRSLDTNALSRLEQTVQQGKTTLGSEHPETIRSMIDLAAAYSASGRLADALPLAEQTVKLCKSKMGALDPTTLSASYSLADIQIAARQYTNAEPLLREVLASARKTYAAGSWAIGDALSLLGESLLRQGKFVEAEPILREGTPILEKYQPNLTPVFTAQTLLGWSLLEQKKFSEAEPLLVKSYEGLKQRDVQRPSPARAPLLKEASERIVRLYEAWGKPDQAAEWKKKLAGAKRPT